MDNLPKNAVIIPHRELSHDALMGVIEQFVTRDGPDSGHTETSLEQKINHVLADLDKGVVLLVYDKTWNSCNILSKQEFMLMRHANPASGS